MKLTAKGREPNQGAEVRILSQQLLTRQKLAPGLAELALNAPPEKECRVMIETVGQDAERICSLVEANHGRIEQELRIIPGFVATLPLALLPEVVRFPQVFRIWEDVAVEITTDQAGFGADGGEFTQEEYQYTGRGITVAVLDTGISPLEEFTTPENRILAWYDLIGQEFEPYDDHGHGTRVSEAIAGNGRSGRGRRPGIAPAARLVGLKVLDSSGCGRLGDLLRGIEWCLDNRRVLNIRIINLTLGTRSQDNYSRDPLSRATAAAWRSGMVVCTTVGRVAPEYVAVNFPGENRRIITVGNLETARHPLPVNDGRLQQPGQPFPGAKFIVPDLVVSGVNPAVVSGGAAVLLERNPRLRPDQVKWVLKRKATDLGLGRVLQGAGIFDLGRICGINRSKAAARQDGSSQLLNVALRSALNLFGKRAAGDQLQIADFLKAGLPLLNRILNGKEG
jgi:serine protease AprX